MKRLGLHQITMMDGGAEGLLHHAIATDVKKLCLFTSSPLLDNGRPMFPAVAPENANHFRALLDAHDIAVINAEYFPVLPDGDVAAYRPAIVLAATLGAKRIVTHVHATDKAHILRQLDRLCDLAEEHGMQVGLEFTGLSPGCASLAQALELHDLMRRSSLGIAVDALHFFRTGGTLGQLRTVDPDSICYAQICDGADLRVTQDYLDEAMSRMIPGEGVFPLREFVSVFGEHVDLDVEVPNAGLPDNASPTEWAAKAMAASLRLFEDREKLDDS